MAKQVGRVENNAARRFIVLGVAIAILFGAIELRLALPTKPTHQQPFPDDSVDESILSEVKSQFPVAVTMSPDGLWLLLKTRSNNGFELAVVERATGRMIAKSQSRDNQVGLCWRPDSRSVAYFTAEGGDSVFRPHLWDVRTGIVDYLPGPPTSTPIPRFRWSEDGSKLAYMIGGSENGSLEILDLRPNHPSSNFAGPFRVRSDFRWSWDGRKFAIVESNSPGTLTILNVDTRQSEGKIPITGTSGEIRDLTWRVNTESLALTKRTRGFLELITVDTITHKVTPCVEAKGDIGEPHYSPDGQMLVYELVSESAQTLYMTHCDGATPLHFGPAAGFVNFDNFTPTESAVTALYTSLTEPPAMYEYSLTSDREKQLYVLPNSGELKSTAPSVINIRSPDGTLVPSIFWSSSIDSPLKSIIISVHGGPHLQEMKRWEFLAHIATKNGTSLLAVNYRGSTGYGLEYERRGTTSDRVADVLAACHYAHVILGVPSEKIFLFGTSYGAYLAALAANEDPGSIGGLVLVSTVPGAVLPNQTLQPHFSVAAFHGQNDVGASPDVARQFLESLFSRSLFEGPRQCWRVFPGEGHVFTKTLSWAAVYTKLFHMIASRQIRENEISMSFHASVVLCRWAQCGMNSSLVGIN